MPHRWRDGLYWLVLYAAFWLILTGGGGWLFGTASVLAATALSLWLGLHPWGIRVARLPGFAGFFLREVAVGGWDVAQRALNPRLPLHPAWVRYRLTQNNPRVNLLLSAMIGLLPGTFCARIYRGELLVHTLDSRQDWRTTVEALETRLAGLLREAR